jgi:RNA polymerase sigma-70 factor (ECF subfamily)
VLFKIWKSLPEFEFDSQRARFRTWLSRVIRNKVIDRIRSQKTYDQHLSHLKEQTEKQEEALMSSSELDGLIERQWQRHLTKKAFENIEPIFSKNALKVFELSLMGKSAKEICEQLEIAQDSVRVLKNRVQKRFIEEVQYLRSEVEL